MRAATLLELVGLASVWALVGLGACTSRPSDSASETGTSESSSTSEVSTTTETSSGGESETDTGEPVSPCDCAEGELCVADCSGIGLGVPVGKSIPENVRCFSNPDCPVEDLDNPMCRELLCGSAYYWLEDSCDPSDPPGIDLLCSFQPIVHCDVEINDCPDGEKCIPLPTTAEGLAINKCVYSPGDKPAGSPCTREDDGFDDCDGQSLCWGGELVPEGETFGGTCLALCNPECPPGESCQALDPEGVAMLCAPGP